jgi:hypothetical protein
VSSLKSCPKCRHEIRLEPVATFSGDLWYRETALYAQYHVTYACTSCDHTWTEKETRQVPSEEAEQSH